MFVLPAAARECKHSFRQASSAREEECPCKNSLSASTDAAKAMEQGSAVVVLIAVEPTSEAGATSETDIF